MAMKEFWAVLLVVPVCLVANVSVGEVTYFEKDGTTYRETRETIRRPVSETRMKERERTVYRDELKSEYHDTYRTTQIPVTEYRWETRVEGIFNPFVGAHLVQRLVPKTRWETRTL
jgi:hypothetical protein